MSCKPSIKRLIGWFGLVVAIGVAALGGYAMFTIGPRNLWGMLRYDQREEGSLVAGQPAPDVALLALDGVTPVRLGEHIGERPLVLVFGSFT
jgi:hypothetical protein